MTSGQRTKGLLRDRKGAIYVEFLIVFLPLFCMFMSLVQLAFIEVANLVTKHAAVTAARAAIVVLPDDPQYYSDRTPAYHVEGDRKKDIETAAKGPLRAVAVLPIFKLTFPSAEGADDSKVFFANDDTVRVRLEFLYDCKIPVGRQLMCNFLTGTKTLKAEAAMPMQGATYDYSD